MFIMRVDKRRRNAYTNDTCVIYISVNVKYTSLSFFFSNDYYYRTNSFLLRKVGVSVERVCVRETALS